MTNILYLTLKKKWFDQILNGEKKIEYREMTPYWKSRLLTKEGVFRKFDVIEFRNGYRKDSPKFRIEFLGIRIGKQYEILLGEILD